MEETLNCMLESLSQSLLPGIRRTSIAVYPITA